MNGQIELVTSPASRDNTAAALFSGQTALPEAFLQLLRQTESAQKLFPDVPVAPGENPVKTAEGRAGDITQKNAAGESEVTAQKEQMQLQAISASALLMPMQPDLILSGPAADTVTGKQAAQDAEQATTASETAQSQPAAVMPAQIPEALAPAVPRSDYTADAGPAEKVKISQTAQAETTEDKAQYPIGRLHDNSGQKQEASNKTGVIIRDGGAATQSRDFIRAPAADEKILAGKPCGGKTSEAVSLGKTETAAVQTYGDKTDAAGEADKAPDKKANGPQAADAIMSANGIGARAAPAQDGKLSGFDDIQNAAQKEPALQILDGIRQHEGKKDAQFTLQLYPKGLGQVSVQMTWQENKMKLAITAHSAQTEELMRQQAPALRSAMDSSHIELAGLEFGAGTAAAHEFITGNGPGGGFGGASAWEQDSGGTAAPYGSVHAAPAAQKTQESAFGYPEQTYVLDCIA